MRIVIVGTGTDIGKTHVGCALVERWRERGVDAIGLKPIESGLRAGANELSDQERLAQAGSSVRVHGANSTFHVKRPLYGFVDPVSPHLAARAAGLSIDLRQIRSWVDRAVASVVVVETPGGLFSPLSDEGVTNFDLVAALEPTATLLVAPDRLGVLHDVTATLGYAATKGLCLSAVVLSSPAKLDQSTGQNAAELRRLGLAEPLAAFPREPSSSKGSKEAADQVISWFERQRFGPSTMTVASSPIPRGERI